MSNNFDRAVNILQGALNTASFSPAEESNASTDNVLPQQETESLLPSFERPPADTSPETTFPRTKATDKAADKDPFAPPPDASAPPLPGFATPQDAAAPETAVPPAAGKATSLELHPPAKKRALLKAQQAKDASPRKPLRISKTTALSALSGTLGVGLIVACACLLRSPDAPGKSVPKDIPLALLPDTADPALWDIVSEMHGEIDGESLQFSRGIATGASGRTYKLAFDFCRSGSDIYAKVAGDKLYVVRLDNRGEITKSYPAPKNNRPLKDIFVRSCR